VKLGFGSQGPWCPAPRLPRGGARIKLQSLLHTTSHAVPYKALHITGIVGEPLWAVGVGAGMLQQLAYREATGTFDHLDYHASCMLKL
jgi:hypothetical protein